jgi:hypothetical protein
MLLLDDPNATLIKLKHNTQAQLVNYQWARFAKIMLETIYKNV